MDKRPLVIVAALTAGLAESSNLAALALAASGVEAEESEPTVLEPLLIEGVVFHQPQIWHPAESLPAEIIKLVGEADYAAPFFCYYNPAPWAALDGSPLVPDGVTRYGHCIAGERLVDLVDTLLDPHEYMWGAEFSGFFRTLDEIVPRFGLQFSNGLVIEGGRCLVGWWAVEPYTARPGGVLRPAVLGRLARGEFPEVEWKDCRVGWHPQEYWTPRE